MLNLFRRDQLQRRIDDELAFHLAERTDALVNEGLSREEARRLAERQLGNGTQIRENVRHADIPTWLESFAQDICYGIRSLAQQRAFTITAIFSLALGIGANTAIFNVINAVMLRALPVEDPAKLVQIQSAELGDMLTYPIWEQIRNHQQSFSGVLAYSSSRFELAESGDSQTAQGLWVSGDFFRALGVPAYRGRIFSASDDQQGAPPLAVISYSFWRRQFPDSSDPTNKTVRVNGHTFTIAGVTPPWFKGLEAGATFDIALPLACEPLVALDKSLLTNRRAWRLYVLGRLPTGGQLKQAAARVEASSKPFLEAAVPLDWDAERQKSFINSRFSLRPATTGFSNFRGQYKTALWALMTIAMLVLLATCLNIANLLLAHSSARQRELSVRFAVGATRMRVVRQLLTECALLTSVGTLFALLLASWGSSFYCDWSRAPTTTTRSTFQ